MTLVKAGLVSDFVAPLRLGRRGFHGFKVLRAYLGPEIESSLLVLFKRLATCDLVSASFR